MPNTTTHDYRAMGLKSAQTRRINALEKRIKDLVNSAPPLTAEQRDRLALLLRPGAA